MEQELPTLPDHLSSPPVFSGVRVARSLVLYVCFVLLYFFFWPVCCLFFFDIRILITPLICSSYSYNRIYNWNYTPLLVVYSILVLSSSMTYRQIRNKTNVTRRVPLLQQKLLNELEQPSSSSCFVEFALPKP